MKLEEIPKVNFWPYDLFGYLMPGATLVLAVGLGKSQVSTFLGGLWTSKHPIDYVLLVIITYLTGTLIAAVSALVLEGWVLRGLWKFPTNRMFVRTLPHTGAREPGRVRRAIHGIGEALVPRYRGELGPDFQNAVQNALRRNFEITCEDSHDHFWLCWAYISQHHPAAFRRGTHFVELYGLSRNTAMAFILIAMLPLLNHWPFYSWEPTLWWWNQVWISAVMAIVFFSNYAKMMRRLDDEVYHAFLVAVREQEDLLKRKA